MAISPGIRVSLSIEADVDANDHRMKYSHYVGHVLSNDGTTLTLSRDRAADGSRSAETIHIPLAKIRALKPVPERRTRDFTHHGLRQGSLS
ncbi:MAG: hypothetical protein IIT36_01480 [Aeriscardovia sp.]|nr:hypothetical protein [Aeriscardovia sp.]